MPLSHVCEQDSQASHSLHMQSTKRENASSIKLRQNKKSNILPGEHVTSRLSAASIHSFFWPLLNFILQTCPSSEGQPRTFSSAYAFFQQFSLNLKELLLVTYVKKEQLITHLFSVFCIIHSPSQRAMMWRPSLLIYAFLSWVIR